MAAGVVGVVVLLLLGVGAAATWQPGWYVPAAIDQARLKSDQKCLFDLLDGIGRALNAGQSCDLELGEPQVNRWITARAEFWPDVQTEIAGVSYPQLQFLARDRVRIGATVVYGGAHVVVSAVARLELSAEHLRVHLESANVGALPLPCSSLITQVLARLGPRAADAGSVTGRTVALRNEWRWPNGKARFRMRSLQVTAGGARIALEPLGTSR